MQEYRKPNRSEEKSHPNTRTDTVLLSDETKMCTHTDASVLLPPTDLNRCLVGLRCLDEADDLGQHSLGANTGGAHIQQAGAVDGAAYHAVAGLLGHLYNSGRRCTTANVMRFEDTSC